MIDIVWLRRDLRLHDNAALYHALQGDNPVQLIFIFDTHILNKLENKADARVAFIYTSLMDIKKQLQDMGGDLWIFYGTPAEVWTVLTDNETIANVYCNRDYESYAKDRDDTIKQFLRKQEIPMHDYKDHVIFDRDEVVKKDGDPYVVYTPYKNTWLEKLHSRTDDGELYYLKAYPCDALGERVHEVADNKYHTDLGSMGFEVPETPLPVKQVSEKLIKNYGEQRNYPAEEGTSRLGMHYRFGTISIRQKARKALGLSDVYLSELIWRDFYSMILDHFPHVEERSFRKKYDNIVWRNNEKEFEAWCVGKTGYPMVDAGMRQLNTTGYMHNRVRMVTASFLTKHLLIDWRWGEAYFAEKLLDYDLASNNGGWQWAAGCGTDAAPYFRIFNPASQLDKYDKDRSYVRQYIEEWDTDDYPDRIVDHKEARERCLRVYKEALDG